MPASLCTEHWNEPSTAQQQYLLSLARLSIEQQLSTRATVPDWQTLPEWLRVPIAAFVTLHRETELRGCVGSLSPRRELAREVWLNAQAAAFEDPRFPPLHLREWPDISISLSLLTPAEPILAENEQELLEQLEPSTHGVIVEQRGRRATFLPEVWQHFVEAEAFLQALRKKAGLSNSFEDDATYYRYTTVKIA